MAQLRPLGLKFVQWAREAHIAPSTITTTSAKKFFGGYREVPKDIGWLLDTREWGEANAWGQRFRMYLAVLPTGDIQWLEGPARSPASVEQVERLITDYIVKSKSSVPWPD